MLRELAATLWDALLYGDLWLHLVAWWEVARGEVGPETRLPIQVREEA